ncbi:MAG: fluoride efflux transporter CrcB [Bacteroidetes bacterium]|nr:fluoride efflux transporter CrcB [Bacteroidota bacterium]
MQFEMILAVGAGGGIGAALRYLASGVVYRWTGEGFPYGTLAVNILGSLFLGFIVQVAESRTGPGPVMKMFLTVGLCGGFTTFSTFSLETWKLLTEGSYLAATGNAVLSVLFCLFGIWFGMLIAKLI